MRHALLSATTALTSALLAGCSDRPSPTEPSAGLSASPVAETPAAAARVVLRFPLEGQFGLGFTSPCTGGSVEGTGEIAGRVTVVGEIVDEFLLLGLHVTEHGTIRGTVVDQSTGTTYAFHQAYHSGFNTPSGRAPNFNTSFSGTVVARPTAGEGAALLLHVTTHTTVNANGVESSTVEATKAKCLP